LTEITTLLDQAGHALCPAERLRKQALLAH